MAAVLASDVLLLLVHIGHHNAMANVKTRKATAERCDVLSAQVAPSRALPNNERASHLQANKTLPQNADNGRAHTSTNALAAYEGGLRRQLATRPAAFVDRKGPRGDVLRRRTRHDRHTMALCADPGIELCSPTHLHTPDTQTELRKQAPTCLHMWML